MSGRNFFVFFDGTSANKLSNTNIFKLLRAITKNPDSYPYYEGPGERHTWKLLKILDKYLGFSVNDTAINAYKEVLRQRLSEDDRLFVFGYSRGAISARIFCQMVTVESIRSLMIQKGNISDLIRARIFFVGLFDPVIGFPHYFSKKNRERQIVSNPRVANYVEILAMDEGFILFDSHSSYNGPQTKNLNEPMIGIGSPSARLSASEEFGLSSLQRRKLIWMPGDHADIGGQDGDPVLSSHALLTMLEGVLDAGSLLNDPIEPNVQVLDDCLTDSFMDSDVTIGKNSTFFRRVFARKRVPSLGDFTRLHNYAQTASGRAKRTRLISFLKDKTYLSPKGFEKCVAESSSYQIVRKIVSDGSVLSRV